MIYYIKLTAETQEFRVPKMPKEIKKIFFLLMHNYLPVNLFPARYQPTNGAGRVPRTSHVVVKRCPSRNGPNVVEFLIGLFDSSMIWIVDGGTAE